MVHFKYLIYFFIHVVSLRALNGPTPNIPSHCVSCGTIVIAVSDQGAGLSTEELGKLFGEGVQFNVNKLQAGQGR